MHFHEDMGDVVMALAKKSRWEHAVELARRRRKGGLSATEAWNSMVYLREIIPYGRTLQVSEI